MLSEIIRRLFPSGPTDDPESVAPAITAKLEESRGALSDCDNDLAVAESEASLADAAAILEGRPVARPSKALDELRARSRALRAAIAALEAEQQRASASARDLVVQRLHGELQAVCDETFARRVRARLLVDAAQAIAGEQAMLDLRSRGNSIIERLSLVAPRPNRIQYHWLNYSGPAETADLPPGIPLRSILEAVLAIDIPRVRTLETAALITQAAADAADEQVAAAAQTERERLHKKHVQPILDRARKVLSDLVTSAKGGSAGKIDWEAVEMKFGNLRAEINQAISARLGASLGDLSALDALQSHCLTMRYRALTGQSFVVQGDGSFNVGSIADFNAGPR